MKNEIFDCAILGAGPAGLGASLYCARGGLNCALIDISSIGGTPCNYLEIENYLGFSKINSFELCEKFENHIDEFDIKKFPYQEIENIDLLPTIKTIKTKENIFRAKSVIIASGAKPRKLNIKGEKENVGRGVSYCAVCDGAFYKDKIVCVIGGGNSALESAQYLSRFAKKVYLIHRREIFRADEIIIQKIKENKKIELILNSEAEEILSNDKVYAIKIKNNKTNRFNELKIDGIFPYIGIVANNEFYINQLQLDNSGFIVTDNTMKTNIDGVFAIGDIRNTPLRQVITAISDGAIAGVEAVKYLNTNSVLYVN